MKGLLDLKAILFDLGGTLIKTRTPAEIIKRILEKYGVRRSVEEIAEAHRFSEENTPPEDYELQYYDFWIKWNRRIFSRLGIEDKDGFLARALVDEWWDNAGVELYPDAIEALIRLKGAGLKIGIVTNAFRKDIEEILKRVYMPIRFDALVGIDSAGRPKPSPEIFLYAIRALNISPGEAVHVGDDIEKDYIGALKAGLKAILIDRNSAYMGLKNIVRANSLSEVPDLILRNL